MKIKSASFVSALKAAFEQLSVSAGAAVTLNRMILEAEQGNFLLFARFFDNAAAQDGSGVSDGAVLGLFKSLTDDAALADAATQAFTKAVAEIGLVGDDSIVSFAKALSDGASSSDAVRLFAVKQVSEIISSADDAINVLTGKHAYDITTVSDAVAKGFSFSRTDSALLGDANTVTLSKVSQDLTSIADAGSLLSQGFTSDPNYFAEDFVGASRAF